MKQISLKSNIWCSEKTYNSAPKWNLSKKIIIDVFNSRVFLNQTYVNLLNENVHVYFQTNFLIKQD